MGDLTGWWQVCRVKQKCGSSLAREEVGGICEFTVTWAWTQYQRPSYASFHHVQSSLVWACISEVSSQGTHWVWS